MISILFFSTIFGSLTQVLTLNCSDIRTNTKGLSILVKRDLEGSHSYWIYDNNGNEWEFHLMAKDRQMDLKGFNDNVHKYDGKVSHRFESYTEIHVSVLTTKDKHHYKCGILIESQEIQCNIHWIISAEIVKYISEVKYSYHKPLIMKLYPSINSNKDGTKFVIFNKENKTQRSILIIEKTIVRALVLKIVSQQNIPNIGFVDQMNDTLFSGIDSVADYNWDKGLSGWMLWFNIDGKHYYCFQPEGKPLSQQCSSKENLTLAFKECYDYISPQLNTTKRKKDILKPTDGFDEPIWPKVAVILVITAIFIAIIAIVIYCLNIRTEDTKSSRISSDAKSSEKSKESNSTDISKPTFMRGSITNRLYERNKQFIESKSSGTTLNTTDPLPSVESVAKHSTESKPKVKAVYKRGDKRVNTSPKASVNQKKISPKKK